MLVERILKILYLKVCLCLFFKLGIENWILGKRKLATKKLRD